MTRADHIICAPDGQHQSDASLLVILNASCPLFSGHLADARSRSPCGGGGGGGVCGLLPSSASVLVDVCRGFTPSECLRCILVLGMFEGSGGEQPWALQFTRCTLILECISHGLYDVTINHDIVCSASALGCLLRRSCAQCLSGLATLVPAT